MFHEHVNRRSRGPACRTSFPPTRTRIPSLSINGQPAGEPIGFYEAEVRLTSERLLGEFELKASENEISVTVVGANEKAMKSSMFGLDYLLLRPVD